MENIAWKIGSYAGVNKVQTLTQSIHKQLKSLQYLFNVPSGHICVDIPCYCSMWFISMTESADFAGS